jgi:hypothetical protein
MKKSLILVLIVSVFLISAPFAVQKASAANMTIVEFINLLINMGVIPKEKIPLMNNYLAFYSVTASSTSGTASSTASSTSSAAAPLPTASLTVNNLTNLYVTPDDYYVYRWNSTNGVSAYGSWTSNNCGPGGPMFYMNSLEGRHSNMLEIESRHIGCIWNVSYFVRNRDGVLASSTVVLKVLDTAPSSTNTSTPTASTTPTATTSPAVIPLPTASLTVNNLKDLSVTPDDYYVYNWKSTNAVSAYGNYTSNDSAKCGPGGQISYMNTLDGTHSNIIQIQDRHDGCIWNVNYIAKNSAGATATSTVILRVK